MMLKQFKRYISSQKLFARKDNILLTVSGGIDSIVMCDLFNQAGLKFGIAHCNFQLRGIESDTDEIFVEALAAKYKVPYYINHFNTLDVASGTGVSIQMAARQLRYDWFDEVLEKEHYQFYATAHHQNDEIETFFINLLRGTGIAGLHGISPKQHHLIRPMLFTNRGKIEKFAFDNHLDFREDSSNSSVKYLRNAVRHIIIPELKHLAGEFEKVMIENIEKFKDAEIIFNEMIALKRNEIVVVKDATTFLSIEKLKALHPLKTYLFHLLTPYGFNNDVVESLIVSLDDISGKQFFSPTHRLLKDRAQLIITEINHTILKDEVYRVNETDTLITEPLMLEFRITTESEMIKINPDKNLAYLDFDKLKFPLTIRKWEHGDFFSPFGMQGKKKVSDFFTDQKFSILEKENTWLLCSGDDIVWIIGWRIDEHHRLTSKTVRGYLIELKHIFL